MANKKPVEVQPDGKVVRAEALTDPLTALLGNPEALQALDVDKLERMLAMKERMDEKDAERQLYEALAAFQSECPDILPAKERDRGIKYPPLGYIARVIAPTLKAHGLSYTWSSEHTADPRGVHMTCTVRHAAGASVSSDTWMPFADIKGANDAQRQGGTETYARRHSLVSALGLTTADPDTDAMLPAEAIETITDEQAANLIALAEEIGRTREELVSWLGNANATKYDEVQDLPAKHYARVVAKLESMRGEL